MAHRRVKSQQSLDVVPTLVYCLANVVGGGPINYSKPTSDQRLMFDRVHLSLRWPTIAWWRPLPDYVAAIEELTASCVSNWDIPYPANMRRWPNFGLLLAHRLRRWSNSKPTLGQRLMFAGYTVSISHERRLSCSAGGMSDLKKSYEKSSRYLYDLC